MGAAQQLGLILWKNFILRKRNPGIFFLELIWPILIFVIVALVRIGSPPTDSKGCHYAPRSMPSTGGMQFLQSFSCNLDNKCYNDEFSAQNTTENPRMKEFLKSTEPLFRNPEQANNLFHDLPQALDIMNKMQDTVEKFGADTTLTVGMFLKNRTRVRHQLVDVMSVLPGDIVDALLDSTINITTLYNLTGMVNFKEIVCDPQQLGSYLYLNGSTSSVTAEVLSRQLCNIGDDKISEIVQVIQDQLDIAAIIKMVSNIKLAAGEYNEAKMLEDISTMVSVIQNSSVIRLFLDQNAILGLKDSVGWVLQVVKFITGLVKGDRGLDINSLQQVIEKMSPVISNLAGNATWWRDLKTNFNEIYAVLGWIQNINPKLTDVKITLSEVFGQKSELSNWIKQNLNLSETTIRELLALEIDFPKLSSLISRVSVPGAPVRGLLCVSPGLVSIYRTNSTATQNKITQLQTAICRLNMTLVETKFRDEFDVARLMKKLEDIRSGQLDSTLNQLNWTLLYRSGMDLYNNVMNLTDWLAPLLKHDSMTMQAVWESLTRIATTNTDNWMSPETINAAVKLGEWIYSMFPMTPIARRKLLVASSYLMDVADTATEKIITAGPTLTRKVKDSEAMRRFMGRLLTQNQDTMYLVLKVLSISNHTQSLKNNPSDFFDRVACNVTYLREVRSRERNMAVVNVTVVKDLMCNRNITLMLQTLADVFDLSYAQSNINNAAAVLLGSVDVSGPEYDSQANITAISNRWQVIVEKIQNTENGITASDAEEVERMLRQEGVQMDTNFWMPFVGGIQEMAAVSLGYNVVIGVAPALERSDIWATIAPYVEVAMDYADYQGLLVNVITGTFAGNSMTGRLMELVTKGMPQTFESLAIIWRQPEVGRRLLSVGVDHFCNHGNWSSDQTLPSVFYQPQITAILDFVCRGHISQVTGEWNAVLKALEKFQKYFEYPQNKTHTVDWDQTYWTFYQLAKDLEYQIRNTNPLKILDRLNMSRFDQSIQTLVKAIDQTKMATGLEGLLYAQMAYLQMLDHVFSPNTSWWNVYKYQMSAYNDILKAVTKQTATAAGGLRFEDLINGSPRLHAMAEAQAKLVPDFMKAVENAVLEPEKMMKLLLTSDLTQKTICKDISLTDFMTFENQVKIQDYEKMLCSMDMQAVLQELSSSPMMAEYTNAFMKLSALNMTVAEQQNTVINWTEMADNFLGMFSVTNMTNAFNTSQFLNSIPGLNVTESERAMNDFMKKMQGLDMHSLNSLYKASDEVWDYVKAVSNDTVTLGVMRAVHSYMVTSNSFFLFINPHLERMKGANISVTDLLMSEELDKMIRSSQASPEILKIILNGIVTLFVNPNKVLMLAKAREEFFLVCNDTAIFNKFFPVPADSSLDVATIQSRVCNSASVDFHKMWRELMQNTEGLAQYVDVITKSMEPEGLKDYNINMTVLLGNSQRYTDAVTALVMYPPTLQWSDLAAWTQSLDWSAYIHQFVSQIEQTVRNYTVEDLSKIDWGTLSSLFVSMEGDLTIISQMNAYVQALITDLSQYTGSGVNLDNLVSGAMETTKLLRLLRKFPVMYDVVTTTQQIQPQKISPLMTGSNPLTLLCATNDLDLLFYIPENLRSEFTQSVKELCAINTTALGRELAQKFNFFSVILNTNATHKTANMTTLSKNLMALSKVMTQLAQTSSWTEDYSWLLNYDWNATFHRVSQYYDKMTLAQILERSTDFLPSLLAAVSGTAPGNQYMGQANAVIEALIQELQPFIGQNVTLDDLVNGAMETQKLLGYLRKLPVVYEVAVSTLVSKPEKLSPLWSSPSAFQLICAASASNNLDTLFEIPTARSREFLDLVRGVCSINVTVLTEELSTKYGRLITVFTKNVTYGPVNVTAFNSNLMTLNQLWTQLAQKSSWSEDYSWLLTYDWMSVLTKVAERYQKQDLLTSLNTASDILPTLLSFFVQTNDLAQYLGQYDAFVEALIAELTPFVGQNVTLNDLVSGAVETQKLLGYLKKLPVVYEVVITTVVNRPDKLSPLWSSPSAFQRICSAAASDSLDTLFEIPTARSREFLDLVRGVCSVNVTVLTEELSRKYGRLVTVFTANVTYGPVNMTSFSTNLMTLSQLWTQLSQQSSWTEDYSWLMSYDWMSVLTKVAEKYKRQDILTTLTNTSDILPTLFSALSANYENNEWVKQYLGGYNAGVKALIQELSPFVGQNVTLTDLVSGSVEAQKLLGYLKKLPVVYEVVITTVVARSDKLTPLWNTSNPLVVLCTAAAYNNLDTLFEIPTARSREFLDLVRGVCSINVTVLTEELSTKYGRLVAVFTANVTYGPINMTAFTRNLMTLNEVFIQLVTQSRWTEDYSWINNFDWTSIFQKLAADYKDQAAWTSAVYRILPYLDGLLGSYQNTSVIRYLDATLNGVAQGLETLSAIRDPASLFSGLPLLEKVLNMLQNLPDILATWTLSSVDQAKFGPFQAILSSGNATLICEITDIQQYLTIPSNVTLNFNDMKVTLCDPILLREFAQFASRYNPMMNNPDTGSKMNLTVTFQRYLRAQQQVERIMSTNLTLLADVFPWLQAGAWHTAFKFVLPQLEGTVSDAGNMGYVSYIRALQQLSEYVNMPSINSQINLNQAILSTVTGLLERIHNRTLTLPELMPNSPETQKLLDLVGNMPEILSVLSSSYSSPQFQQLLKLQPMEALSMVCHPATDLKTYFTVPKNVDLDLLKVKFCSVNFTSVQTELMTSPDLNINYIMEQWNNTSPVNWTSYLDVYGRYYQSLQLIISNPPTLLVEASLYNYTTWMTVLDNYVAAGDISGQAIASYKMFLDQLSTMTGDKKISTITHSVVSAVIDALAGRVSRLPDNNITLAALLGNDTRLLQYLTTGLHAPAEQAELFLHAVIRKPQALARLFTDMVKSQNPLVFCNKTVEQFRDMFELPPTIDISFTYMLQCDLNTTEWTAETLKFLGIGNLIEKLGEVERTKNYSQFTYDDVKLKMNLDKLTEKLQQIMQNGNNFKDLEMNYDQVSQLFSLLMQKYGNLQDTQTLLDSYSGLLYAVIQGSDLGPQVSRYFEITKLITNFFSSLLKPASIERGTLKMSSFFGNATDWIKLLETTFKVSPKLAGALSELNVKIRKISELFVKSEAEIVALFCSSSKLEEYFTLPASIDVNELTNALCGLNVSMLLKEAEAQFNVMSLVKQVQAAWNQPGPFDTEGYRASYDTLVTQIMRLINVTEADFFGMTSKQLSALNLTVPWPALFNTLTGLTAVNASSVTQQIEAVYIPALRQMDVALKDNAFWTQTRASLAGAAMFMDVLNGKIQNWPLAGLTLHDLLADATYTSNYLQRALKASPEVISALLHANIDWAKLVNASDPSYLCSGDISWPAGTDKDAIRTALCSLNVTQLVEELRNDWDWDLIRQKYTEASGNSNYTLDWAEYYRSVSRLQSTMTYFFTNATFPEPSAFLLQGGDFNSWLQRLGNAFTGGSSQNTNSTLQMVKNSLEGLLSGLRAVGVGSVTATTSELIQGTTNIVKVINTWLKQTLGDGRVTLSDLLTNKSTAGHILQSVLSLQPEVIEALLNARVSQNLYLALIQGYPVRDIFCNVTALSEHLQLRPNASVSVDKLQVALCDLNATALAEQLANQWNINALIHQFERWASFGKALPQNATALNVTALYGEWEQLVQLITKLIQQPPSVSGIQRQLNFSQFMSLAQSLISKDLTGMITQAVKSAMVSVVGSLPKPSQNQFILVARGINSQLKLVTDTGLTIKQLTTDGSAFSGLVSNIIDKTTMQVDSTLPGRAPNTSSVQGEVDRMLVLYNMLSNRGYFTADVNPESLLLLLQQEDLYKVLVKQLEKVPGLSELEKDLHITNTVMGYLNKLIQRTKNEGTISLQRLVPDPETLRKFLQTSLNPDSAEILMLAGIKPQLLTSAMNQSSFVDIVCDPVKFRENIDLSSARKNATQLQFNTTQLQRSICGSARNGSLLIQQLLGLMDVKLFYQELSSLLSKQQSGRSPWAEYIKQTQTLANNIQYLIGAANNGTTGLVSGQWLKAMGDVWQAVSSQSSVASYVDTCNSTVTWLETIYPGEVTSSMLMSQFYLNTSLLSLHVMSDLEDLICKLPSMNLTELMTAWESTSAAQLVNLYQGAVAGNYQGARFDCDQYVKLVNQYTADFNRTMYETPKTWGNIQQCLVDYQGKAIPAFSQVDSFFDILREAETLLTKAQGLDALLGQNTLLQMDNILKALIQQKPNLVAMEKLWRNETTIQEALSDILYLSPSMTKLILSSSVDMNMLSKLNISEQNLGALLCDPEALSKVLTVPISYNLSSYLCGANLNETLKVLLTGVNIGRVISEMVNRVPEYGINTEWLTNIQTHVDELIRNMDSAFKLYDMLANIDKLDIGQFLGTLQTFLGKNSPEKIFKDLNNLLEDLRLVLPPGDSKKYLDDIVKIVKGISSLNILMPFDASISSLMKDPRALKNYLMNNLKLSENVASTILNSSLSFAKLVGLSNIDIERIICVPSELMTLLTFNPNNEVNVTYISSALCGLPQGKMTEALDFIIKELDIGNFIKNLVSIDPKSILASVNVTTADLQKLKDNIQPFQGEFKHILKGFSDFTSEIDVGGISEALTGEERGQATLKSFSKVLCGRENAFDIDDSYRIGSSTEKKRRRKRQAEDEKLSRYDRQQLLELRTDFCRDLYKVIIKVENGAVFWFYLKPLIRGKILYSPNTPETKLIMEKATKIFSDVDGLKELVKNVVEGLGSLSKNNTDYTALKNALKNPFIADTVGQVLGLDPSSFLSDLDSLNGLDSDQQKKVVTFAEMAYNLTECLLTDRLDGFESEKHLVDEAEWLTKTNTIMAGVVFDYQPVTTTTATPSMPSHIKYTIRMDIENIPPTNQIIQKLFTMVPEDNFATDMRYLRGFLQLQDMIDGAIIELQTGNATTRPSVQMQQFPFTCHRKDNFQLYIGMYFFPIVMTLAWLVSVGSSINNIVYDKEKRLEETMKIMGLRSGVNWFGWFFNTLLGMLIVSFFIVLVLKLGRMMPYSDPIILFVYLADFSFSVTMFCYMISTFFTRTTIASLSGVIIYLVSYLPFVIAVTMASFLEFWHTILLCLSCTTAFSYGAQLISRFEQLGVGLQWDNAGDKVSWNFTFVWCCYMMLIDGFIYGLIGWYIRNVCPGRYGIPQPWYFPVSPSYWGCRSCKEETPSKYRTSTYGSEGDGSEVWTTGQDMELGSLSVPSVPLLTKPFSPHAQYTVAPFLAPGEPEPTHLDVGISLHKLCKTFKKGAKKQEAVSDLSLNLYKGQITALLGQNGAGKTTTINLLTGYMPPTSGTAFVEGVNIRKDITQIREQLGICPQQDVLFEFMTVHEHLDLYVSLKSKASRKEKKEEIQRMLEVSGLRSKMYTRVCKLSGGQRRRLCVLLAFVGGSKVIILDEPTSGVDPSARRDIWDLIVSHRQDRTILLSTHHLYEADVLSDRIVMIHKGKLVCGGSPLYLKTHFGSGYHLTFSKEQQSNNSAQPGHNGEISVHIGSAKSSDILKFVQQHVPRARIIEEIGTELTVVLPTDEGQIGNFHRLFAHLDSNLSSLHVSSYGLSDTSLEEIFLKLLHQTNNSRAIEEVTMKSLDWKVVGDQESDRDSGMYDSLGKGSSLASTSKATDTVMKLPESGGSPRPSLSFKRRVTGCGLSLLQFGALFNKRIQHHMRDPKSYFSQIILPVLFMVLAMACTYIRPGIQDMPSLQLTPGIYSPEENMFFRLDTVTDQNKEYVQTLLREPGVGTSCMADSEIKDKCTEPFDATFKTASVPADKLSLYQEPRPCTCDDGRHTCPEGAAGLPLPYLTTQTSNVLYNISASQFHTDEYLLRTFPDFLQKRMGGWSFNNSKTATVWFNNKRWHAMPAMYNALSNMVLRAQKQDKAGQYGITVYSHPLPLSKNQLSAQTFIQGLAETGIALTILCAFCFVPAGYTIYLIHERTSREKRLQFVCGVGLGLYWFTALVWDLLAYMLTVGLAVAVAAAFRIPLYSAPLNLAGLAVTLLMFGWATIPFMYLLVRKFENAASGFMVMFILNLLIGITTTVCVFLLNIFSYIKVMKEAYDIVSAVFLIFPQYCLGDSLVRLSRNQFLADVNSRFKVNTYVNPFSFDMLLWHFIAMAIEGFCFLVLHLIMETRPCDKPRNTGLAVSAIQSGLDGTSRRKMDPSYKEDEDVSLERQRVMTGEARDDPLVLYNLKKVYKKGTTQITAVDNLTLGVQKGECFGLLGVNGAGKTTSFHMMTGEVIPTVGAALLDGVIISENLPQMDQRVGYCPQTEALDPNLTVTEILHLYGKLKGIPADGIKQVVPAVITMLALDRFSKVMVKNLSGGTKRKLSTAVALLGEPDVLLMDEPTTGMDPQTKRLVWNIISAVVKDNRSVILTSHSMDECEALCTRLSVMVNGRLMCLGNRQHLKSKFGSGYIVSLKVNPVVRDLSPIVNYMLSTFNDAVVKDHRLNMLEFEIPHASAKLSDIFGSLEESKGTLKVQDYSVTQTSLDQVFIGFARHQNDGLDDGTASEESPVPPPPHKTFTARQGYINPAYYTYSKDQDATKIPSLDIEEGQDHSVIAL